MTENEGSWVDGYEQAFWRYYAGHCGIEAEDVSEFGWEDYRKTPEFKKHMKSCRVDRGKTLMPIVESWWRFNGTFTDNDRVELMCTELTCICTKYRGVKVRFEGNLSSVLLGVLHEAGKA